MIGLWKHYLRPQVAVLDYHRCDLGFSPFFQPEVTKKLPRYLNELKMLSNQPVTHQVATPSSTRCFMVY